MQVYPPSKNAKGQKVALYIIPSLLLIGTVALLWEHCQYYIDPDAISYLNITEQYVAGNFHNAINGYWSPLGCWLSAIVILLTGLSTFQAAILVNTIAGLGMSLSGQYLFNKFRPSAWERWSFGISLALFWAYAIYYQSFTDLWQFFFLTLCLCLLLSKSFFKRPFLWILLGVLGGMAFFGKAYSFYFFPIMVGIACWALLEGRPHKWRMIIKVLALSWGPLLGMAFIWIYLLHHKYGIWTVSTASGLNMSWRLIGVQELRDGLDALVPPPYQGSLFYFEDPWAAQGARVSFWQGPHLLARQFLRTAFNALDWVRSANSLSPFYFITWALACLCVIGRNKAARTFDAPALKVLLYVFLVFPLPFWLLTFDNGRYLWFTLPMASILAMYFAEKGIKPYFARPFYTIFLAVYFASITVTPLLGIKQMAGTGKEEHTIGQQLQAMGIQGPFISNLSYADAGPFLIRVAWFSKSPWYCHRTNDYSDNELLKDAKRYAVPYYFYFYKGTGSDFRLRSPDGYLYPELTGGAIKNLLVFKIEP